MGFLASGFSGSGQSRAMWPLLPQLGKEAEKEQSVSTNSFG